MRLQTTGKTLQPIARNTAPPPYHRQSVSTMPASVYAKVCVNSVKGRYALKPLTALPCRPFSVTGGNGESGTMTRHRKINRMGGLFFCWVMLDRPKVKCCGGLLALQNDELT